MPKITRVRCIRTRATGTWVIVKVETDQPGLYGIGSAHDYNATGAVVAAIEEWMAPRLIGREADRDRGHLAVHLHQRLLAQRPDPQHRPGRDRHRAVGHQGQGGRDARLPAAGRPLPDGRALLRPRQRAHPRGAGGRRPPLPGGGLAVHPLPARRLRRRRLPSSGASAGVPPQRGAGAAPRAFDDEAYVETVTGMFDYLRDKLGFGAQADPRRARAPAPATWPWPWPSCWSRTGSSSWRTCCPRSRSPTTARSASSAPPRRRWASCSSTPTSGCR